MGPQLLPDVSDAGDLVCLGEHVMHAMQTIATMWFTVVHHHSRTWQAEATC